MKTLRERLNHATFWDGWVCLWCGETTPEEGEFVPGDVCPACDGGELVSAARMQAFLSQVEAEDED